MAGDCRDLWWLAGTSPMVSGVFVVYFWCNIAPDEYWREYHHAEAKHYIHAAK